ncbi:MAG: 2-hydroxychromene-2-carboxylate isomerase [Paracoccaceae bacterium]|jgi:2-hydroxychromene-2-carboxylate isomerase
MPHIDYYFSTISPNSYLAGLRLEAVAEKHGCSVAYKPLDIMGLFARTGGTPPKDRHPSRQAYRLQELRRQAKKAGLPLHTKPAHWPTNPAPSSYALIAAAKTGGGEIGALAHGLSKACWAEQKDISQDDVIRDALTAAGFDPSLADSDLLGGAEEYAANLEHAIEDNVFGAPFYVVDKTEHFWGQDRIEDLDLFLSGKL